MNNRNQYNRCIIPEICRGERGWILQDAQRFKELRRAQEEKMSHDDGKREVERG